MKKIIIPILFLLLLTSCNSEKIEKKEESTLNNNTQNTMAEQNGENTTVVIDTNHPLAGKKLIFEVEMVKIDKKEGNSKTEEVEKGDKVEVHYTGTLEDGEKFDSSHDRNQTLPFEVGAGQMIKGFDAGVVGMTIGEKKILTLEPKDAYGEYDENRKQETVISATDRKNLEAAGYTIEVGAKLPTMMGEVEILEIK